MRRITPPDPAGWLLSGVWYQSAAEYQRAVARRDERRRRLLALIETSPIGEVFGEDR
jgi:hypothetical protein